MPRRRYIETANRFTLPGIDAANSTTLSNGVLISADDQLQGTYTGGPADATNFYLGDIIAEADNVRWENTVMTVGWPNLVDPTVAPTLPVAGDNYAIPANWELDPITGRVVTERRCKVTIGGNNIPWLIGNTAVTNFIGVDFYVEGVAELYIGPSGSGAPSPGTGVWNFYDCRFFIDVPDRASFSIFNMSANTNYHGIDVLSNTANALVWETFLGNQGNYVDMSFQPPNLTATGTANPFRNAPLNARGVFAFANSVGSDATVALDVGSIWAFTGGASANTGAIVRSHNAPANVMKVFDLITSVHATDFHHNVTRDIVQTTVNIDGVLDNGTDRTRVEILRKPSNQEFRTAASLVEWNLTPYISTSTAVPIIDGDGAGHSAAVLQTALGSLEIPNTGMFTFPLRQYYSSQHTVAQTSPINNIGVDAHRIIMENRYRFAFTKPGYTPIVMDDYFLGGQLITDTNGDVPNSDTYFGVADIASRQQYSPMGESLIPGNIINMVTDSLVTVSDEAVVVGYFTGASTLANLYDAIHYHANHRADGAALLTGFRGIPLASVNAQGLIDFGNRVINMGTATINQNATGGALSAVAGTDNGAITVSAIDGFGTPSTTGGGINGITTLSNLTASNDLNNLTIGAATFTTSASASNLTLTTGTMTMLAVMSAQTYNNVNFGGDVASLAAAHTVSNCTYAANSTITANGHVGSVTLEDVLGTDFTLSGPVTITTGGPFPGAYTIITDNPNVTAAGTVSLALPDIQLDIDITAVTGEVHYSLVVNGGTPSLGTWTPTSIPIEIAQSTIGSGTWDLVVVCEDGVEVAQSGTYAQGSATVTVAANPLFNSIGTLDDQATGASPLFAVNTTLSNATNFVINIPTGVSLTVSEVNRTFFSFKSTQQYAVYLQGVYQALGNIANKTITATGGIDTILLNDGVNGILLVVVSGPVSGVPEIANLRYYDGTVNVDLEADVADFNTAIVTPLSGIFTPTGGSPENQNLGIVAIAGTTIDYGNVGNQVTARLTSYGAATGGNITTELTTQTTAITDAIDAQTTVIGTQITNETNTIDGDLTDIETKIDTIITTTADTNRNSAAAIQS